MINNFLLNNETSFLFRDPEINNFLLNNGISFLFGDSEKVVFNIFSILILAQMQSLSIRVVYPSLVIEALLTSSFLLIPRPPSDLGLQTPYQATKGNP